MARGNLKPRAIPSIFNAHHGIKIVHYANSILHLLQQTLFFGQMRAILAKTWCAEHKVKIGILRKDK